MAVFQNRQFSIFFHRLVLGLAGLIDAKGIDVTCESANFVVDLVIDIF